MTLILIAGCASSLVVIDKVISCDRVEIISVNPEALPYLERKTKEEIIRINDLIIENCGG